MHFTLQEKVVPAGVAAAKPEWMQWENELWEISQYLFTVRPLSRAFTRESGCWRCAVCALCSAHRQSAR